MSSTVPMGSAVGWSSLQLHQRALAERGAVGEDAVMGVVCNPPGGTPNVGVPVELAARMSVAEQHDWVQGFLRGRAVSRRAALRAGAGLGLLGGMGALVAGCGSEVVRASSGGIGAQPVVGRRISYGADPRTQMVVAGELSARPAGPVLVDIGTDTGYGTTITAEIRQLISHVPQADGRISSAEQFFVHAGLDRLAPGRRYHYRFRLPGGAVTPDAAFSTAPDVRVPFRFTAFGDQGVAAGAPLAPGFVNDYTAADTRRAPAPADAMVSLISRANPAFNLLAGDICYADPTGDGRPVRNAAPATPEKYFDNFDPLVWSAYFHSISASAATTPWMFATGNHDMEALYDDNHAPGGASHGYGGLDARLDFPAGGPAGCPSVYAFTYSNLGVISADANDWCTEIPTNAGYSNGRQISWIRRRLAGMRADPTIDFIVVFFHECAYATGESASDSGVRAALTGLCDEFNVDLAIQGHNHQYERTNPIKAGRGSVQAPDGARVYPVAEGTTYICVGSGGRPRGVWRPGETDRYRNNPAPQGGTEVTSFITLAPGRRQAEHIDWSQARYRDYALIVVDVIPAPPGGESVMRIRAISDLGREIDTISLARPSRLTPAPRRTQPSLWRHAPTELSIPAHV